MAYGIKDGLNFILLFLSFKIFTLCVREGENERGDMEVTAAADKSSLCGMLGPKPGCMVELMGKPEADV